MKKISVLLLLILLGCNKKVNYLSDHAYEFEPPEFTQDIKIPTKLWDEIEKIAKGENQDAITTSIDDLASTGLDVHFTSIEVLLNEKNKGVLKHPSYKIKMPIGGGEIDLSTLMADKNGSFYLGFSLPSEYTDLDYKVFFVSRGKKRKIDNEVIGSGCNVYFELTKEFNKKMKKEGILVNTTRYRHISLLAGNFIFVAQKEKKTLLTQVQFTDSTNKALLCEDL